MLRAHLFATSFARSGWLLPVKSLMEFEVAIASIAAGVGTVYGSKVFEVSSCSEECSG